MISFLSPDAASSLPAAAGEWWGWGGILELILSGLAVVMAVLILLAALTGLMGRIFVVLEARRTRRAEPPAFAAPPETDEIDPALVAVLAAAAAESLQADVRIVKIRRRPDSATDWAVQGRMSLHSSHQLWKGGSN